MNAKEQIKMKRRKNHVRSETFHLEEKDIVSMLSFGCCPYGLNSSGLPLLLRPPNLYDEII